MSTRSSFVAIVLGAIFAVGCAKGSSPISPSSSIDPANGLTDRTAIQASHIEAPASANGRPGYSSAYYNGTTVTMSEINVPQNPGPLAHAAADFYVVIYPANHALWPPTPPLCNPCDHNGNGIDVPDFHDHVLDSIPADPGHGEFSPLWHRFVIRPANTSAATQAAYAARLPMTSEAAVDAAVAAGVASETDSGAYFICAIVDAHAAP